MVRQLAFFSLIPVIVFSMFIWGQLEESELNFNGFVTTEELQYSVPLLEEIEMLEAEKLDISDCFANPKLGKSFIGFKEALAFKESRGDYESVNTLGYMGKYQFGKSTLELIGIYNTSEFLRNPELQEKAFIANAMRNKWVLRRDIKRFVGKTIDGVKITESGILAAAHLAGPGSVKKYLRSYGAIGFADAYGTTVRYYMKKFSGYDTSFIKAEKTPKVTKI